MEKEKLKEKQGTAFKIVTGGIRIFLQMAGVVFVFLVGAYLTAALSSPFIIGVHYLMLVCFAVAIALAVALLFICLYDLINFVTRRKKEF